MKLRLKNTLEVPPGYFQFTIPQLEKKVYSSVLFSTLCRQFREISLTHPHLGLPIEMTEIRDRLDEENAIRVAQIDGYPLDMSLADPPEYITPEQPCYLATGSRFGDLMIILPGLKHEFEATGVKPVVVTSHKFSSLMDGVSYADCWPIYGLTNYNNAHLESSYTAAKSYFKQIIVPKWWEIRGVKQPVFKSEPDSWMSKVSPNERDSYMTRQWQACGWTIQELLDWPLVFDRRDARREQELVSSLTGKSRFLLYCFKGFTSPFREGWKLLEGVADLFPQLDFVDLGGVKAERIYDLLGLLDRAVCLITIDTATFHLSAASNVPTIHLQRNGHGGSLPRGNSVLRLQYGEVEHSIDKIRTTIQSILNENKLHRDGIRQGNLPAASFENHPFLS